MKNLPGREWSDQFPEKSERGKSMRRALERIQKEVVGPAFARNYANSGLKAGKGVLKQALVKPGAKGNFTQITGNTLTAGLNEGDLPYVKFVLDGRGPVVARRAKALRWFDDNGKPIFAKRVRATKPHPLVYLNESDMEKARVIAIQEIGPEVKGVGFV